MYVKIKLTDILKSKGLSNRGFAKMTGIRHPSINDYCNNDTVHLPLDNLAKICLFLNCPITDILELIPEKEDGFHFTFPEEDPAEIE